MPCLAIRIPDILFIPVFLLLAPATVRSQQEAPSNSFAADYKRTHPSLHYAYDDSAQVHDYSGNWDLDGDGQTDRVFFTGTGGAHLYFSLGIVLTSDHTKRDYRFIVLDMPVLPSDSAFKKAGGNPLAMFAPFAVTDPDKDGISGLFIRLDRQAVIPRKWEDQGLTSRNLLITALNGKVMIRNYPPRQQ